MEKEIEKNYKILDHISHVLLRPQSYVGYTNSETRLRHILENNKFILKQVTYTPSFLKIFDEIITNSIDESKRNNKLNKIDVNIDLENNIISIKDNGGIPVIIHSEYKIYIPEVIFGNLMSSSNYDDSKDKIVGGLYGLGAKLTNIFSKEFKVTTCDGKKLFSQIYTNNMRERTTPVIKKSKDNFTEICYKPDLKLFNMDKIDYDNYKMLEKRIYDLAATNTNIKFTLNNKDIKFNSFKEYINMYVDEFYFDEYKNTWQVGVALSKNGYQQISFVNSVETTEGGTHVDYVLNQLTSQIKEHINKKYKTEIKPSDIKNHIFIFLNTTIVNPVFSSLTKEKLITNIKENNINLELNKNFIQNILKSEIIHSISEWIEKRKYNEETKLQKEINKKIIKAKVDKLIDAKSNNRALCSIGIFEGDSAISAFRKYRNPQYMGGFALRGKFINASEMNTQKLLENEEVINLMKSIGLKIGEKINNKNLRYGKILLYVDADVDGNSIAGLLINFFNKYWSELFEREMIYKVETPIIVATPKNKKGNKILFYNQNEYSEWTKKNDLKKFDIKYKKGLAALVDDEYQNIIINPRLTLIKKDDLSDKTLDIWFGKNVELRKNELMKN